MNNKTILKTFITITLLSSILLTFSCSESQTEAPVTESTTTETTTEQTVEAIFPQGQKGSDQFFTGNAYNYGLVPNDTDLTTLVGNVYFEAGARSNWHTHPGGQILIITDGVGYHQIEGQPKEVIKKGDVVTCPPNVRHWHGASTELGMQQLYIVPNTEKGIVNWQEAVDDATYLAE